MILLSPPFLGFVINCIQFTLAPDGVCNACTYKDGKGTKQRPLWRDPPGGQQYYPSHNVSPGSHTPVMLSSKHYPGELEGVVSRVIQPMMWGMVPSWHKGDPKKVAYETNNCRAEGMLERRTFKIPLEKGRRCVVLADGFFEWKREKDQKQPYFIYFPRKTEICTIKQEVKDEHCDWSRVKTEPADSFTDTVSLNDSAKVKTEPPDESSSVEVHDAVKTEMKSEEQKPAIKVELQDCEKLLTYSENNSIEKDDDNSRLLTMAGVFDVWTPPDGSAPIYSYSIITVAASPAMDWIHHRMPAMLTSDEEIGDWLDFGNVPVSKAVKRIRPTECIQLHPVSSVVNNSRNKTPDCVKPVSLQKPKPSASSALMMSWLAKPKKEGVSPDKASVSPPKKKKKFDNNPIMNWLSKAAKQSKP